ncbi:hypothetical protein RvY_02396 [Ramazzottius varieornatus]|uniref:Uncharacterized protein n=1 Tax=Ramazzottius varieornatus TaxID=947166 RepID=A0A1D1UKC1_RAMVA|nr:hypothetical protein RvY_02396 [Ramazzottius varieornatus]
MAAKQRSALRSTSHPREVTPTNQVDDATKEAWAKKRDIYKKKFQYYHKLLKMNGAAGKNRKPIAKVPLIKWKFERGPKADRERFRRLRKSEMWVDKKGLRKLQEKSKHATEYARKVMFHLLITNDEVISLSEIKPDGVGFVKLFGQKNWNAFYGSARVSLRFRVAAVGPTLVPTHTHSGALSINRYTGAPHLIYSVFFLAVPSRSLGLNC